MGAEFLKCSELELDRDESKKLADSIAEVNKFHNVVFNPKTVAYINMGVVACTIYGTRIVAIKNRMDSHRKEKQVPVTPIRQQTQSTTQPKTNGKADFSKLSPSEVFGDQSGAL